MIGRHGRTDRSDATHVWIFHGDSARYASGVFADRDSALAWAARHDVTGILTKYPVGIGCYDLAVEQGRFTPTKPHHGSPSHVVGFSPPGPHIHLRNGAPACCEENQPFTIEV